jgi:hypothetical protein
MNTSLPTVADATQELRDYADTHMLTLEEAADQMVGGFSPTQEVARLAALFDRLAAAIGWSKERQEQTGEDPFEVAQDLVKRAHQTHAQRLSADVREVRQ